MFLLISPFFFPSFAYGKPEEKGVATFKTNKDLKAWKSINDGVMGGLSEGRPFLGKDKSLNFKGALSLENNGGFSSICTEGKDHDFSGWDGLVIRVKGEGRSYQLTLQDDRRYLGGAFAFWADFTTEKDKWKTLYIPFQKFYPTSFGQRLPLLKARLNRITSIGFMLYDKLGGPFHLKVKWIKVYKKTKKERAQKQKPLKTLKYILGGLKQEIEKDGLSGVMKSGLESFKWALKKMAGKKNTPSTSPQKEERKTEEKKEPEEKKDHGEMAPPLPFSPHPSISLKDGKDRAKREKKLLLLKIQAPW